MIVGVLAVASCSSGGDDAAGTTGAPDTTAAPTTTAAATAAPPTAAASTAATAPVTTAPPTTAPPTTAAAPELEPATFGEYAVGVQTITVDDPSGQRPLTVDVWFPLADGAGAALAPQRYTLLPGVFYESPQALAATPADVATGPFPLVVYSHGSGGLRYIHSAYTELLASHGYVVAAPDHTGNTAVDRLAGADAEQAVTAFNRPNDVRRVIDALTDPAHPTGGAFAAQVDAERIAVTGHSFGGFTSVAMVTGFTNEVGEVAPDARVDAIVPLAPAVSESLLPDDVLATVGVPMMVVVGTDDVTTPVDPNVTRLWDLTTGAPAYRVELVAGEHQSFTDLCAYQAALPALENVPQIVVDTIDDFAVQGCSDGDMAADRVNELTGSYVLAFLAEVFSGGDPITAAAPDDVLFRSR